MITTPSFLSGLNPVDLASMAAWVILLLPALAYLWTTWRDRRQFFFDRLTPDAIELYYQQFLRSLAGSAAAGKPEKLRQQFKQDFGRVYGQRHYVLPLLLLAFISGIGLWMTAKSIHVWLGWDTTAKAYPPIAVSAFLGAYAWVLYDQLGRFRTGDFTSDDVYGGVYRFLIAIPLGISLAAFLKDDVGVAVAFLLSAFPTTTLITISRRLASKRLDVGETEQGGPLELEKLQCVGKSNAERYLDEGVSTIAELAWTDPIDLTVRTNRELSFVIDSISQALLWIYFEDGVKKLYPLGLRGAQEVTSLIKDLGSKTAKTRNAAEETLKNGAALMGLSRESFIYTLLTVTEDPYAKFLYAVWD